jgi:hypothetical protein
VQTSSHICLKNGHSRKGTPAPAGLPDAPSIQFEPFSTVSIHQDCGAISMLTTLAKTFVIGAESYFLPGTGFGPLIYAGHLGAARIITERTLRFPIVASDQDRWSLRLSAVDSDASVLMTLISPAQLHLGTHKILHDQATDVQIELPEPIHRQGEALAQVTLNIFIAQANCTLRFHQLQITRRPADAANNPTARNRN